MSLKSPLIFFTQTCVHPVVNTRSLCFPEWCEGWVQWWVTSMRSGQNWPASWSRWRRNWKPGIRRCSVLKRRQVVTIVSAVFYSNFPLVGFSFPFVWISLSIQTSSPVSTGIGDHLWRLYHSGIYPGPLSLAIPLWVGAGYGFGHLWEETASSACSWPYYCRTFGILAYCVLA